MSEIKWQEPPPAKSGRGQTNWPETIEELRKQPGRWALVLEGVKTSNGVGIRKRYPVLETTVRSRPDGNCDLYARYVGEGDES